MFFIRCFFWVWVYPSGNLTWALLPWMCEYPSSPSQCDLESSSLKTSYSVLSKVPPTDFQAPPRGIRKCNVFHLFVPPSPTCTGVGSRSRKASIVAYWRQRRILFCAASPHAEATWLGHYYTRRNGKQLAHPRVWPKNRHKNCTGGPSDSPEYARPKAPFPGLGCVSH